MDEDMLGILAGFLIVFVPVAGLTARIALKPVIEAYVKVLQARQTSLEMQTLERRLALVEQEIQAVRTDVHELGEQKEFYRKLAEPSAPPAPPGS
ncbi:MAG TPA: hypothetical protein VFX98_05050 [Longimicrobiaceae bacterium]|nr:hypothetical protein [Longimicrobiaceae bacterium]